LIIEVITYFERNWLIPSVASCHSMPKVAIVAAALDADEGAEADHHAIRRSSLSPNSLVSVR
jgi:hypothetical protein